MDSSVTGKALRKLVNECVRCHADTSELRAASVQRSSEAELVHINCASCQGSLIALVFSTGAVVSSVGLVSDLSLNDARNLQQAVPISQDELLALHTFFSKEDVAARLLQHY